MITSDLNVRAKMISLVLGTENKGKNRHLRSVRLSRKKKTNLPYHPIAKENLNPASTHSVHICQVTLNINGFSFIFIPGNANHTVRLHQVIPQKIKSCFSPPKL